MKYKDILHQFSKAILNFSPEQELSEIVVSHTQKNLKIYQRNYLGLMIKVLSDDFPVTKKYLGDANFFFMVKAYVKSNKIRSKNIFSIGRQFPAFLGSMYNTHQDDFVDLIAQLDLLWSLSEENEIVVPKGTCDFWRKLSNNESCKSIVVNFDELERVKLVIDGTERRIVFCES